MTYRPLPQARNVSHDGAQAFQWDPAREVDMDQPVADSARSKHCERKSMASRPVAKARAAPATPAAPPVEAARQIREARRALAAEPRPRSRRSTRGSKPKMPEPKGELEYRQSLHAARRRRALRAGDRRRRQQGDAAALRQGRHAAEDAGVRRGAADRGDPLARLLQHEGEERDAALANPGRGARRRGAARARGAGAAAGRRAQDRERRAEHRLRRAG